ncbi:MAG TPA: type II secretion system protein GspL [Rubellimicrobium sp.]|nr:type II secretion system protein GspL [Rubellimicrobium sp.]
MVAPREDAVHPFPRPAGLSEDALAGPLAHRIRLASGRAARRPAPHVIPSELVTALVVDLPKASARQRAALLTFAVEERIGAPIESVTVAPARLSDPSAPPGRQLALVVSRAALAAAASAAPRDAPILPDFLALRRPEAPPGDAVWAVWRDGARAVVRRSDGTGFAVATDALPALWARAGRPALLSLGAALPSGLTATDLSAVPPDPDPLDLAFNFRTSGEAHVARPFVAAAVVAGVALVLHLGLAALDAVALGRIAATERAVAEAALAPILPGVVIGPDPSAILAHLAPTLPSTRQSDFLPLLSEAAAAILDSGRPVTFRRLSWGAEDGTLALLVQGAALDDLQAAEQALRDSGLTVTAGAASAGDGGAEVEMRVARGGAG